MQLPGIDAVFGDGTGLTFGGDAGPAGPSAARGGQQGGGMFDSSSWNVSFGNSKIDSTRTQTPLPGIDGALSGVTQYLPYIALIFGGLILWKTLKKKGS